MRIVNSHLKNEVVHFFNSDSTPIGLLYISFVPPPFKKILPSLKWLQVFLSLYQASILGRCSAAKSLQLCPTLCDPIDGSPPGSPVPGILQARILEWVAISFYNAWKLNVKVKLLSRVRLLATPWTAATRLLFPWDFPGKSTGVGSHCLLWGRCWCSVNVY